MMPADTRPNEAEIDLLALGDNVALVRSRIRPGTAIIASVKANAYGHGIVPVARRLTNVGVEVLATGSIADAIAMRDAGLQGIPGTALTLIESNSKDVPEVHLKVDRDRLGFTAAERMPTACTEGVAPTVSALDSLDGSIVKSRTLFGHLPSVRMT